MQIIIAIVVLVFAQFLGNGRVVQQVDNPASRSSRFDRAFLTSDCEQVRIEGSDEGVYFVEFDPESGSVLLGEGNVWGCSPDKDSWGIKPLESKDILILSNPPSFVDI